MTTELLESPRIWTARYSNPRLRGPGFVAVRITRYPPRYPLPYSLDECLMALAPTSSMLKIDDRPAFETAYFALLEKVGVAEIELLLGTVQERHPDQNVVLCCFEKVQEQTGNPEDWCHRRSFAEWWLGQTGERVDELGEGGGLTPPLVLPEAPSGSCAVYGRPLLFPFPGALAHTRRGLDLQAQCFAGRF